MKMLLASLLTSLGENSCITRSLTSGAKARRTACASSLRPHCPANWRMASTWFGATLGLLPAVGSCHDCKAGCRGCCVAGAPQGVFPMPLPQPLPQPPPQPLPAPAATPLANLRKIMFASRSVSRGANSAITLFRAVGGRLASKLRASSFRPHWAMKASESPLWLAPPTPWANLMKMLLASRLMSRGANSFITFACASGGRAKRTDWASSCSFHCSMNSSSDPSMSPVPSPKLSWGHPPSSNDAPKSFITS
mmetsp:Transcript_40185/g.87827  ORF Transcript_40185/g.87827 Transcript_40185/m.87827 type:complete len:251 (+) Transcript_40185:444-1196(+)